MASGSENSPALWRPANGIFSWKNDARCEAGEESFFVYVFVRIRMRTKTLAFSRTALTTQAVYWGRKSFYSFFRAPPA